MTDTAAESLEVAYNNRARVPEHPAIFAGWTRDAQAYRAQRPDADIGVVYGPRRRNLYDLFPASSPGRPIVLFIHGGYWQALEPALFSHLARGLAGHDIAVAVAGYTLCPDCAVSWIVEEMRTACIALHRRFGQRLTVVGHSAGGHLAAAMLATDFSEIDPTAPALLTPAVLAVSGLFDLTPLVVTSVNDKLKLTPESARAVSPLLGPVPPGGSLDAVVGGDESAEYLRQSRSIVDAWGSAGVATRYVEVAGANHFTVIDALADPESAMTCRVAEMAHAVAARG